MVTDAILLVGCRKRDGGDYGTSPLVWFRPNVDSPGSEAITARFKGSSVYGGTTVREDGRFVEVRGCRRHSSYSRGQRKDVGKKGTVETFSGEWTRIFIFVGCRGFSCSRRNRA